MSGFDSFLGNGLLISRLKRDIASGRMAHAYIIEGAKGCGKRTLAKLICRAMSCTSHDSPCMECLNCDKITRDQSPDVVTVEPENGKVQLGVDVIRRVREDAVFAPIDLNKKFYIINNADSMNPQAQNALLKILEEPPSHVMFLILSENADELLSTVRSRAPILRVESLTDTNIRKHLLEESEEFAALSRNSPDAFNAAIKLSRGSLGSAKELLADGGASQAFEIYNKAIQYIELLAQRKNAADDVRFYEYAAKIAKSKQRAEFEAIMSLLSDATRDLINAKLTKKPSPIFYSTEEKASLTASHFTLSKLMALVDVFSDAKNTSAYNGNISLIEVQTAISAMNASKAGKL